MFPSLTIVVLHVETQTETQTTLVRTPDSEQMETELRMVLMGFKQICKSISQPAPLASKRQKVEKLLHEEENM